MKDPEYRGAFQNYSDYYNNQGQGYYYGSGGGQSYAGSY